MWLPPSNGRTAAEFPLNIGGGGSIPSYLLQRHDPYAEVIKTIAPAIKEYIAQQKADAIANQFLNMENPPRAEAVDPNAYDPKLAFSQGLNSQQAPQATAPNTGGVQAYKADLLYRQLIEKQQADQSQSTNDYWTNKVKEAQSNKIQADADAPDPRMAAAEAPVVDPQTGLTWNGRQWVKPPASADSWSKNMVIGRGELNEKGEFVGKNDGSYAQLMTPAGKTMVVPWESYQSHSRKFNPADMYRQKVQQAPLSQSQSEVLPPVQGKQEMIPTVTTKEERDALPSGAIYTGPDGKKHRKP